MNDSQEQSEADKQRAVYVGPRPYLLGQELYGRDREAVEVVRLLISQRLVLLHSPSGAGKSSLIHAKIVPALQKRRFEIPFHENAENGVPQPVTIRLNREPSASDPPEGNRYKLSALLSLELQRPKRKRRSVDELAGMRIDDYLEEAFPAASRDAGDSEAEAGAFRPLLLLFDQFEELLTMDPTDEPVKQQFMRELGDALKNKGRWALFAIREDYLGALEPYLPALPTDLSATYRLDLLRAEKATAAIEEPALSAGVTFEEGVVQNVVEDLRRIRVQAVDGSFREKAGIYIEPVQLQVVCESLWRIRGNSSVITQEHLEKLGQGRGTGVDAVLAGYYADRVAEAASEQKVSERLVRNWFSKSLIGSQQIRRPVLIDEALSFGLSVYCLEVLDKAFLIRRENRSGATWYELAHDRLMAPVIEDNQLWRNAHLTTFQTQAELWEDRSRPDLLLLSGDSLEEAEREAERLKVELTAYEKEFLEASQKARARQIAEQAREQELSRVKILRKAVAAGALLLVVVSTLAAVAFWQWLNAEKQKKVADRLVYSGQISHAQRHLAEADLLLAKEMLDRTIEEFRGWEYEYLDAQVSASQNSLSGHKASVRDACFIHGGTQVATASVDDSLKIWYTKTRLEKMTLKGHANSVNCVEVSADDKWFFSGGDDKIIIKWDAETGKEVQRFTGHRNSVTCLAIDPQSKWIVSGGDDKTLILWDFVDGSEKSRLEGHTGEILCVAVSPDGQWIISSSTDKTIKKWDLDGNLLATFEPPVAVTCLAVGQGGQWFLSGSYDKQVCIWDAMSPEKKRLELTQLDNAVSSLALFETDYGVYVTAGDWDGVMTRWVLVVEASESSEESFSYVLSQPESYRTHSGIITSLSYSPNGDRILSASADNTARIWDRPPQPAYREFANHNLPVWDVDIAPNGKWFASAGEDSTVGVFPLKKGSHKSFVLRGHQKSSWCVAISADGKQVASGAEDGVIIIWDAETGGKLFTLEGHTDIVSDLAFSPTQSRLLISGSYDRTLKLWDTESGKLLPPFKGDISQIWHLNFSPDGKQLVSCSGDNKVRIWDIDKGKQIRTLSGNRDTEFVCVAFDPLNKRIASGTNNGTILVWDLASGKKILTLRRHTGRVTSLDFSPDGKRIVSGGEDNTVKLWELETGQTTLTLTENDDTVWAVHFTPDGRSIVSCSTDWSVKVWSTESVVSD